MILFGISIGEKKHAHAPSHGQWWKRWGMSPRLDWASSLILAVAVCASCALYGFFLYRKVAEEGEVVVTRPTPVFKADVLTRLQTDFDARAAVHASSVYTPPVGDPHKAVQATEVSVATSSSVATTPRSKKKTTAKAKVVRVRESGTAAALPAAFFGR
jgi:hypothetical protein